MMIMMMMRKRMRMRMKRRRWKDNYPEKEEPVNSPTLRWRRKAIIAPT